MPKIKFLQAAPNETSGVNLNLPIRRYDTHPNLRFNVGDFVMPLDWEEPPVKGEILGLVAEDRVIVQWPTQISQEDVDDLVKMDEYVGQTARSRVPTRHGSRVALGPAQNWYQGHGAGNPTVLPSRQPQQYGQAPIQYPTPQTRKLPTQADLVKQHGAAYNPFKFRGIKNLLIQSGLSESDINILAEDIEKFKSHYKNRTRQDWATSGQINRFATRGNFRLVSAAGIQDSPIYKANQKVIDKHRSEMGAKYNPLAIPALQKVLRDYGLHQDDIQAMANKTQSLIDAHVAKNGAWQPGASIHPSQPYDPYGAVSQSGGQSSGAKTTQQVLNPANQTVVDPVDQVFVGKVNQFVQMLQDKATPESLQSLTPDYKYDLMKVIDQLVSQGGRAASLTAGIKSASVNDLLRVADLIEQAGASEAAESYRAAAIISKSVSDLYHDPDTREASRDSQARNALLGARDLVLEASDSLRNTRVPAFRVAADLAEMHFAASALYPSHD